MNISFMQKVSNFVKSSTSNAASSVQKSITFKKTCALAGKVKNVANTCIVFVKHHPKATITLGVASTIIGGMTGNLGLIGFGIATSIIGVTNHVSNQQNQQFAH